MNISPANSTTSHSVDAEDDPTELEEVESQILRIVVESQDRATLRQPLTELFEQLKTRNYWAHVPGGCHTLWRAFAVVVERDYTELFGLFFDHADLMACMHDDRLVYYASISPLDSWTFVPPLSRGALWRALVQWRPHFSHPSDERYLQWKRERPEWITQLLARAEIGATEEFIPPEASLHWILQLAVEHLDVELVQLCCVRLRTFRPAYYNDFIPIVLHLVGPHEEEGPARQIHSLLEELAQEASRILPLLRPPARSPVLCTLGAREASSRFH